PATTAKRRGGVRGSRKATGSAWAAPPRPSTSTSSATGMCRRTSRSCSSCWGRPYDRRRLDWGWLLTVAGLLFLLGWVVVSGGEALGRPQAGASSAGIGGDLVCR